MDGRELRAYKRAIRDIKHHFHYDVISVEDKEAVLKIISELESNCERDSDRELRRDMAKYGIK